MTAAERIAAAAAREDRILRLRETHTLAEVGELLRISAARVHQLEQRAIKRRLAAAQRRESEAA